MSPRKKTSKPKKAPARKRKVAQKPATKKKPAAKTKKPQAQEQSRLSAWFKESLCPPEQKLMWEWCEDNLHLTPRQPTAFPGPYRTDATPYVRGWFDAFQDPEIRQIAIKKGGQVAATQTMYAAICYHVKEDPADQLLVLPSKDDADFISEHRLKPLIEDSPSVAAEIPNRRGAMKKLAYRFMRCVVRLVGAQSASKLAQFPARIVWLDEVDKYPAEIAEEGSPISLAKKRLLTYWNSMMVAISTPTTKAGHIEQLFLEGDQRYYFVPCPHCKHMQILKWPNIVFDSELTPSEARKTAHYQCESCEGKITDLHKPWMLTHGEWRPTATATKTGAVSFHLSGLYAPWPDCTFGALVENFLNSKKRIPTLRTFINADLGELWEERPAEPFEEEKVYALREDYARKTIPTEQPVILILVVDVQAAYIVWDIWALGPTDSWLVDHGVASVLEDLDDLFNAKHMTTEGKEYAVRAAFIDSGHRTSEVYRYCRRRGPYCIPLKGGASHAQTQPVRYQRMDHYPDTGKPIAGGLILRHVHPSYFKEELLRLTLIEEKPEGIEEEAWVNTLPMRLHLHEEIDSDYAKQLTAEVPIEVQDKRGNPTRHWKRIRRANHRLDNACYMLAARWMLRKDLDKMEAALVGKPAAPVDETPQKPPPIPGKRKQSGYTRAVKRKKKPARSGKISYPDES